MWVWIPRFIYKIQSANWHTGTAGTIDIQFTKGVDDNWNKDVIGSINLDQTANGSKGTWTNHPAFTFGDTELTGFWVAKFDASGTTDALKFVPNVSSLRTVEYISEMFTSIRNMETNNAYGWGTSGTGIDTHLMKNGEWGAVTYLTQSAYGKNALVWWNPSKEYITGCSSSSAGYSGFVAGCPYAYNTANGLQASTTGNIYGVYDTRGLVWEFTSAYLDNDNQYLRDRGSSIIDADPKYKDVYKVASNDTATDNYALTINKKGDAIYETSSTGSDMTAWYGNFTYMAETENPWILRNSNFGYMGMPGGRMRYHIVSTNEDLDSSSFRATLAVGVGL
jgi:hypothetical protein